jgi:MGT family glycosyltransferase
MGEHPPGRNARLRRGHHRPGDGCTSRCHSACDTPYNRIAGNFDQQKATALNMRKIVILNFPAHGCINPLLATVAELVKRGESIIYYCTEEFRNKIERTGAAFRTYRGLINEFQYVGNADLFEALELTVDMTADKLDYNLDLIREEDPDIIIHDSLCAWGKHMASILRVPAINLMHSYPVTKSSISLSVNSIDFLIKAGAYKIKSQLKKTFRKKYGIDISLGDLLINKEGLNIVFTSKQMALKIYESENTYRFVGPSLFFKNESNDFPFDALHGKKVVYVSLGTLHNKNPNFYKLCLCAFKNTDFFVVIAAGYKTNLQAFEDIPANFLIRQRVPQQKLLEHVDVFITHAGMNSVNEAICNGVPMLLLPHQLEQVMIAGKVEQLGMGIKMNIRSITPGQLLKKSTELVNHPGYKKKALKLKSIFNGEEKTSHIRAADEILRYMDVVIKEK